MSKKAKMSKEEVNLAYGVRSGLEGNVVDQLTSLSVDFKYEPHKISFVQPAKKRSYTPDFLLTINGKEVYIETKGRFLTADRQKHEWIKEQYPDLDIRFVFTNPNARITPTSKTTYADWCNKRGYMWAKSLVPAEWLK